MKYVAVVEDNADNRLLLQAILDGLYEIVEYENGIDALNGLAARIPDLRLCGSNTIGGELAPALVDGRPLSHPDHDPIWRAFVAFKGDKAHEYLAGLRSTIKAAGGDNMYVGGNDVPGWMWGASVKGLFDMLAMGGDTTVEAEYARRTENMALGEMPTDGDVANAIVFFASDLSAAITGQSLDVNGGEVFV